MPTAAYGHAWRTRIRPAALQRDHWECVRCGLGDRAMGLRSALDVAHLSGDTSDTSDENLAVLCRRDHRANDYASWAAKFREYLALERERRIAEKDNSRPILRFLSESR